LTVCLPKIRILRGKLGKQRILLNEGQRRRLAITGKILSRRVLADIGNIVTLETILRWPRTLIPDKWDYSKFRTKVGDQASTRRLRTFCPEWLAKIHMGLQSHLRSIGKSRTRSLGHSHREHAQAAWHEHAPQRRCPAAIDFTTLRFGQRAGWPHFVYYLSWIYLRGVCSLQAAPRIRRMAD